MENYNEQEYEIDLLQLLNAIKDKLIYVIVISLLTALIGWMYAAFLAAPKYEASVNMIVNTRENTTGVMTNDDITSAQKMVNTYAIIIKSNTVLNQVIQKLNLDMSYNELYHMIEVSSIDGTQVMEIAVQGEQKGEIEQIVRTIAEIAPEIVVDAVEAGSCKVVSQVMVSDKPVSPNEKMITVLAAVAGMFVCLAVIILEELLNDYIIDDSDVENKIHIPTLGTIPVLEEMETSKEKFRLFRKKRKKIQGMKKPSQAILTKDAPFSYVEAHKMLRTNLEFLSSLSEMKSIVVTSALPEESKSTTAINLAITLAERGDSVVLVECDLRKPVLNKYMGVKHTGKGLTTYLINSAPLEDCITYVKEYDLSLVNAGSIPPNPSELLHHDRMRQLIGELKQRYDYVIIDTPPITVVTDAIILGNVTDGMLLVIRSKYAQSKTIRLAKQKLDTVGIKLLGAVITQFDVKKSGWHSGYDYGYSDYGYGEKK